MKRLLSFILAILLAFVFVSCAEPETPKFTVIFEGLEYDPVLVTVGEKFKLPTDLPTKDGHVLVVKMGETVIEAGKEYDITEDTVLKCVYEKLQVKINVDGVERTVDYGDFTIPAKNGYYTENVTCGDSSYEVGDVIKVTGPITLVYNSIVGTPDLVVVDGIVQSYEGSATEIVIPDVLTDGTPVIGIKEKAFSNSSVTSVIIGNNVTSIPEKAFNYCSKLRSVVIGDSCQVIGDSAFKDCFKLSEIKFSDKGNLREIGEEAFDTCSFVEFKVPEGTQKLGSCILDNNRKLTKFYLSSTVEEIVGNPIDRSNAEIIISGNNFKLDDGMMISTDGKVLVIGNAAGTIPNGVERIADKAFAEKLNSDVIELVIPDNVKEIGEFAFVGNNSVTTVTLGENIKSIGFSSFLHMDNLEKVNFNSKLEEIGSYAFASTKLSGVITLPDSLKKLSSNAFRDSKKIKELHIPSSVEYVGMAIAFGVPTETFKFVVDKTEVDNTSKWDTGWDNTSSGKHKVEYKTLTP